jgi:glycosyltransferase involved in cell wall biosynthesis
MDALATNLDAPVTVIVAAFNEEATIEECVRRIHQVFPDGCEILVIDGGDDRTGEIVRGLLFQLHGVRYVRHIDDRGKGHAIKTGISLASAPVIAQLDADLQFLPEELPRLVAPLLEGDADVVLGTRFAPSSVRPDGSTPGARGLGNRIVAGYASLLGGQRWTDVLAGMKAWTREAADRIDLQSDHYAYEVEIPIKAVRRGLTVVEVPISTGPRQAGTSSVRVVRDGLRILWDMTRFRFSR